jgi:hypothetical protein
MINGMTLSRWYPYSRLNEIGRVGDERTGRIRGDRYKNYIRDSVKITLDAYTGDVRFYQISDEPIVKTWAGIYPELFTPAEEMPQSIREHMMYPLQLYQAQFDETYPDYHMTNSLTFYNQEDMWDDAKTVLGPIITEGRAMMFDILPFNWLSETGTGVLPASSERTQFTISSAYTNREAMTLRAVPVVYQDGEDYGRITVLQVPKSYFYPGPEQAEAAIDQNPEISEQISWWNRMGAEVVRGHIAPLIIGHELLYVSPLFLRSRQNRLSQIRRVIVVFRGHAAEGESLEIALTKAIESVREARLRGQTMETLKKSLEERPRWSQPADPVDEGIQRPVVAPPIRAGHGH